MKTKYYKYECSKCKSSTVETSKNEGKTWVKKCWSKCTGKVFDLIGERDSEK